MVWSFEFLRIAEKQFGRRDRVWLQRILDYLEDDIASLEDPRSSGKALTGEFGGLWRYRIGSCRVICQIADERRTILVVKTGHRGSISR